MLGETQLPSSILVNHLVVLYKISYTVPLHTYFRYLLALDKNVASVKNI